MKSLNNQLIDLVSDGFVDESQSSGMIEEVVRLVENGADVNVKDRTGRSLLHPAEVSHAF